MIDGVDDALSGLFDVLANTAMDAAARAEAPTLALRVDAPDDPVPHVADTPPDTWEIGDESAWQAFADEDVEGGAGVTLA